MSKPMMHNDNYLDYFVVVEQTSPEDSKVNIIADGSKDDQVRIATPDYAKQLGSTYIVVGRAITGATDPVAAYNRCIKEFC